MRLRFLENEEGGCGNFNSLKVGNERSDVEVEIFKGMMRNILKKLHIMPGQSEEGVSSSSSSSSSQQPPPPSPSGSHRHHPEQKPVSGLSGWLNSVTGRHNSSPPSSSSGRGERSDQTDEAGSLSLAGLESALLETVRRDSEESSVRDPEMEEEYQIQLALELSAREDPEAVQIEAVKQISLGSCAPQNTPAEVLAYRYWNYNSLGYDDKILDGFYDLYGILGESTSEMPSLIDLQQIPVSDSISWEAVLVNRAADDDLLSLEERALMMAVASRSGSTFFTANDLVRRLAALVAEYMGGPVVDPEKMFKDWSNLSNHLRLLVGNMVLPLGQLKIGLARHRALLFKVLADSVGVPCRLIKGQQYTGADDGAMNIVKIDGREYIVDVMAEPGTLIPSDAVGPQMEYEDPFYELSPICRGAGSSHIGSSSTSSGVSSSIGECPEYAPVDKTSRSGNLAMVESGFDERCGLGELSGQETRPTSSFKEPSSKGLLADSSDEKSQLHGSSGRPSPPYAHARSPSWTEGVSSPAVRRMKVKDVSQYMIDAAKENPKLAQKLHDVLLESGVVAPPDLFTEAYSEQLPSPTEGRNQTGDTDEKKQRKDGTRHRPQADVGQGRYLPPLPHHGKMNPSRMQIEQEACPPSSQSEASATSTHEMLSPGNFVKHMPVAAAAAATAAVVASSMVVAAAKSSTDSCLEVPVAAAATATAAAVVATTAAVSRQYEQLESGALLLGGASNLTQPDRQKDGDGDGVGNESQGSDPKHASGDKLEHGSGGAHQEGERISDKSTGTDSVRSEAALEDVAEWEILWDEITLGDRIGLGTISIFTIFRVMWWLLSTRCSPGILNASKRAGFLVPLGNLQDGTYGHTEVAVKKFLDQDISGDALAEFISEDVRANICNAEVVRDGLLVLVQSG
ncbi:hypothetical protein ACLOJK_007216 [Asimina triloba]